MTYWIREFKNNRTGKYFRVFSEAHNLPTLRQQVAKQQNDPEWEDDAVYQHQAGLDTQLSGNHALVVAPSE